MNKLIFPLLLLLASNAYAKVEVAFIEIVDATGKNVQFEEYGRFGHVAVSYQGKWLHAHPVRGVELVDNLNEIGFVGAILESEDYEEPTEDFVAENKGRPFSYKEPWSSTSSTYCAKLVAQIYGILPETMTFSAKAWKDSAGLPRGELGLSADDLFSKFYALGFTHKSGSCEAALKPSATQLQNMKSKFY